MRIIENNYRVMTERQVGCHHCRSLLSISDADILLQQGKNVVLCPCCQRHFPVMTEAETQALVNTLKNGADRTT
jgi:hypothetical protein